MGFIGFGVYKCLHKELRVEFVVQGSGVVLHDASISGPLSSRGPGSDSN